MVRRKLTKVIGKGGKICHRRHLLLNGNGVQKMEVFDEWDVDD